NSIIRYHAHGEDWLIDGDYLVRNTTDHNMISVVRDGRCATLEPAFTRLDTHADLPGVGYTRTTVTDYNGADWTRHILWLKGEGFVVLDELTAREAGDYTFENVYKMLDLGKLQFDGRCVKVTRPTAGGMGSRDLTYTQAEGVGKVVRFGSQSSRMEFPVTLPAGEYAVTLFGQGTGGGTDSFYLAIDDSEPVACHVPIEKVGPSSAAWTKDVPTPNVKIAKDGLHLFRITLREGPGTMLHKVVIADKTGKEVQTIDALKPPPIPQDRVQAAPDACFYLKGDGTAQAAITDRTNNVNLRLKYLRHLFGGKLKAGQTVSDATLFYDDRSDAPRDLDLRRVDDHRVLILKAGKPWGVFVVGGDDAPAFFTADRLDTLGGAKPSEGPPGGFPAAKLLAAAAKKAVAPKPAGTEKLPCPALKQAWTSPAIMEDEQDVAVINRLVGAYIHDGCFSTLLAGRGSKCVAFDTFGKELWTVETGARVNDMCVADLDGDKKPEVLIASDDEYLYIADAKGKVLSKTHCDAQLRVGTSSVRDPRVANVCVGDVDADGTLDIIVGTRNGNIVRYDLQMKKLWSFNQIEHGTFCMRLMDLDKDGKLEVVAGNRYGAVEVVDCKGRAMAGSYSELGDVVFDVADVNGDGQPDFLNGSSTGAFTCTPWRGRVAWNFDNFGYGVRDVKCADVDGDGKIETVVASDTGYVYVLSGDGSVKTMRKLSAPVLSLALAGKFIIAGCRDGIVYELDAQLQPVKAAKLAGPVTQMTVLDMGGLALVAVGAGEAVVALEL
ncbi:MAG: VCBS repeat-containing protein, partial [Armatimonadetes bacterium]|nr:VCBS repeat-containing protein [Armatimonadota bacterium]